jgi:hypothetical protein
METGTEYPSSGAVTEATQHLKKKTRNIRNCLSITKLPKPPPISMLSCPKIPNTHFSLLNRAEYSYHVRKKYREGSNLDIESKYVEAICAVFFKKFKQFICSPLGYLRKLTVNLNGVVFPPLGKCSAPTV